MGAEDFEARAKGKTPQEAFRRAVEKAQYDYGHAGYTGTIAEKDDFAMATKEPVPLDSLRAAISEAIERFDDKWGPAGCIEVDGSIDADGERLFVFFGWASC